MTARPAPWSTFTVRSGTLEDARTPLSPFWDKSGARFWTSEAVRNPSVFGYAYPETQSWAFDGREAYQREIRRTVARLYGSNPFVNFARTIAPVDKAAERPTIEEAADLKPASVMRSLAANVKLAAVVPKEEQKPVAAAVQEEKAAASEVPDEHEPPENPIDEGDLESMSSDTLLPPFSFKVRLSKDRILSSSSSHSGLPHPPRPRQQVHRLDRQHPRPEARPLADFPHHRLPRRLQPGPAQLGR